MIFRQMSQSSNFIYYSQAATAAATAPYGIYSGVDRQTRQLQPDTISQRRSELTLCGCFWMHCMCYV